VDVSVTVPGRAAPKYAPVTPRASDIIPLARPSRTPELGWMLRHSCAWVRPLCKKT